MIRIPIVVFHSGISESISCFIDHSAAKYLTLLIILVCLYIEEEVYSILFFGSMFNMLADELLCSLRFVRYGSKCYTLMFAVAAFQFYMFHRSHGSQVFCTTDDIDLFVKSRGRL